MSDRTPSAADEPTAHQPAVPPEPEQPAPEQPAPEQPAEAAAAPPPPPPYGYAAAAPPPRRPWRDRRVPILALVGALLIGCLCGAGGVAAVGLIARVADHGDRVRIVGRDGGPGMRPGERWRDLPDHRRTPRGVPAPVQSAPPPPTPSAPAPTTTS